MTDPKADGGGDIDTHGVQLQSDIQALCEALTSLASRDPVLTTKLTRAVTVVVAEAARGPRFATALARALREPLDGPQDGSRTQSRRPANRRRPGPLDPFAVYAEGQEPLLRERLSSLDLESLRDIVAEHGMDTDRLAMKWKDQGRVVDRIVDRVIDRSTKGAAFRD